jgi:hypothetical protein
MLKEEDPEILTILDNFSKGLIMLLSPEKTAEKPLEDVHDAKEFLNEQLKDLRNIYNTGEFEKYQDVIEPLLNLQDPLARRDALITTYNHLRTQRDAFSKKIAALEKGKESPDEYNEELEGVLDEREVVRRLVTKLGFIIQREVKEFERGFETSEPAGDALSVYENIIIQWAKRPDETEFGGQSWLKTFQEYLDLHPDIAKPLREYFKDNIEDLKLLHSNFINAKKKEFITNLKKDLAKRGQQLKDIPMSEQNFPIIERLEATYSLKRTKTAEARIAWLKEKGFWTPADEEEHKNQGKNLSSAYKTTIEKKYLEATKEERMQTKIDWLEAKGYWEDKDKRKVSTFEKGKIPESIITWVNEKFRVARTVDSTKKQLAKKVAAPKKEAVPTPPSPDTKHKKPH